MLNAIWPNMIKGSSTRAVVKIKRNHGIRRRGFTLQLAAVASEDKGCGVNGFEGDESVEGCNGGNGGNG